MTDREQYELVCRAIGIKDEWIPMYLQRYDQKVAREAKRRGMCDLGVTEIAVEEPPVQSWRDKPPAWMSQ